ncbi:MAG: rod shape-determining protein MreD [Thiohalomonadaceae bacterium]
MTLLRHHGGWIIALTFIVALLLTMLPLPDWAAIYRPEWVVMVLIYWCLALPDRIGVGTGWLLGLFLDVIKGALIGQHALALALVAYLTIRLHQRIRVFPLWQQALFVLLMVTLNQMLMLWVNGILGEAPSHWEYWLPSFVSMLLWPWAFLILRDLRRKFKVR